MRKRPFDTIFTSRIIPSVRKGSEAKWKYIVKCKSTSGNLGCIRTNCAWCWEQIGFPALPGDESQTPTAALALRDSVEYMHKYTFKYYPSLM